MKNILATLSLAVTLGLNGCVSSNLYKRDFVVGKIGTQYYYGPEGAVHSEKSMTRQEAIRINKLSKGMLNCKKGYALLIESRYSENQLRLDKSKEYQFIKDGKMTCVPPMSRSLVKKYEAQLAQQRRINNDPRVIAARIQANAMYYQQQQQALESTRDFYRRTNAMMYATTPRTINVYHHRGY